MSLPKVVRGAILTGDIVNSTQLLLEEGTKLVTVLGLFLAHNPHEFYRGDSFQAYIKKPDEALRLALACRCLAIGITEARREDTASIADVRISIGIGEVPTSLKSLGVARGEAFLLSGRQFDSLRETGRRLAIRCNDNEPIANIGFEVMTDYLDSICRKMTPTQANLIVELLRGTSQQQYANTFQKSKSTVSQLANAGRWPEIEKVLKQYEQLINLIQ